MAIVTSAKTILPIGIVLAVAGYVVVERAGGLRKLLSLGDFLKNNEHIETGADGKLVIGFMDGTSLELGATGEAILDGEVFDLSILDNVTGFESLLDSMQQALFDGQSLSDILDSASNSFASLPMAVETDTQFSSLATESGTGGEPPSPPAMDDQSPIGGDTETHTPPEMVLPKISIASIQILEPAPGRGDEEGHSDEDDTEGSSHDQGGHDTTTSGGHDSGGGDTGGHDSEEGHDDGGDTGGHDTGGHDTEVHDSGGGADFSAGRGGGYGYAGGSLSSTAVFTITLSSPATREVRVDFKTVDGTAISGGSGVDSADYGHTSGSLVIPVGESEATIEVTIFSDKLIETDEQFYISLSNPINAVIVDDMAIGTIIESGHGHGSSGEGQVLIGTDADDVLISKGGPDVLDGKAGNDTLIAGGGEDIIHGGEGDDLIVGLGGPDKLYGEAGNDEIVCHGGPDLIEGGEGDDIIYAGGAPDEVSGGPGDDFINAEGGPDFVDGGEGNDTIYGGGGPDILQGGAGDDLIYGQGGPDTLRGGSGDDQLYGGGGPDVLNGGEGADTLKGGGAGDVFRFDTLDGAVDRILDFDQHDQIDLSAILDVDTGDPISNYIQIEPSQTDPLSYELSVNPVGSGDMNDFQVIALLDNMQTEPDVDQLLTNGNLIVIE